MRLLLFILLFSQQATANTYFVKANGSAGNGLSDAAAWNLSQLNKSRLLAGDKVLFRRGQVFSGELKVQSGVSYGAYGNGPNPVISGLKTVRGWKRHSGNIWVTSLDLPAQPNLVLINGAVAGMGRYPNIGYLPYTSHNGNSAISGAAIAKLPFNASGAEAVIRKERWILDRHSVTEHRGQTLQIAVPSQDGGYNGRQGVDKNGFFLQNHLATLDREGEWFYDKGAKLLYAVLSSPTQSVKVAVLDRIVSIYGGEKIFFTGLDFEGSNIHGISVKGGKNISLSGCRVYHHGQTGIYGIQAEGLVVKNSVISDCLNNGLWVEWDGNGTTVDSVTVTNCGTIAGAGRSGDAAQQGISVAGNNTIIRNCKVIRTGYNGIHFTNGNHILVENNVVDLFCLVKDDGAGIYNFENDGASVMDRIIRNNTVLHAVGAFAGAESYYYEAYGKAAGIYLDGDSKATEVSGNVIGHGPWAGFFVNNNGNNRFIGNAVFGHEISMLLVESQRGKIRNMVISGNRCVGKKPLYIKLYEADEPAMLGKFSRNVYSKGDGVWIDKQYKGGGTQKIAFQAWKVMGADLDSRQPD